jgi:hypothetical protein
MEQLLRQEAAWEAEAEDDDDLDWSDDGPDPEEQVA